MILARMISIITNPIFIFIVLPFFLVYKTTLDMTLSWIWTIYTLGFLFVFVTFVLIGVKKKFFSDVDVSNKKERPLLYLVATILSILYLSILFVLKGPLILIITAFGIVLGIIFASIINIKLKVSVHVAAISGLFTSLGIIYKGYYLLFLFLIPVIAWARVKIKRHTIAEVIAGAIIGSLLSLLIYIIARFFY